LLWASQCIEQRRGRSILVVKPCGCVLQGFCGCHKNINGVQDPWTQGLCDKLLNWKWNSVLLHGSMYVLSCSVHDLGCGHFFEEVWLYEEMGPCFNLLPSATHLREQSWKHIWIFVRVEWCWPGWTSNYNGTFRILSKGSYS
jgi:hypothetical protein